MSGVDKKPDSPAMALLAHVWKHEGGSGGGKSWRRLNAAMQGALRLAIESLMEFDPDDFAAIYSRFNAGFWIGQGIEHYYSRAVDGPHGPNPSAIKAIERRLGRKPFIVVENPSHEKRIRLHVGARFHWHEGLKKPFFVTVTSFQRAEGDKPACVVACTYKRKKKVEYKRPSRAVLTVAEIKAERENREAGALTGKVDRVFRITHADIAEYHKAIREFREKRAAEQAVAEAG